MTRSSPFRLVGLGVLLMVGLAVVGSLAWRSGYSVAPPFAQQLQAAATQGGQNFVMATGPIDEAVEGVFFLDRMTGMLQCWVVSKNTGAFVGKFWYPSVLGDVGAKEDKNPPLMLLTGNYQMVGAGGKLANCLVYVLNDNTGQFAVYSIPWNAMVHTKGMMARMSLVNMGQTRDPEMFRE